MAQRKVTIHDNPPAAVMPGVAKQAPAPQPAPRKASALGGPQELPEGQFAVDDGKVRVISTEQLAVSEEMKLSRALPPEDRRNEIVLSWATITANIRAIYTGDGEHDGAVAFPASASELAVIQKRVGDSVMRLIQGRYVIKAQQLMRDLTEAQEDVAKN